ncbi:succinate dehydrogenase/fumarate reductase iron-sulfur subunit [Hydrogenobaculum acidophilum]
MIINIKRGDSFCSYDLDIQRNITVLELLHKIKEIDPTLSYRHMCRAGICGTCAVKVNGRNVLACKTRLDKFEEDSIVLEPIDNAVVIKDLVVEHVYWFDKYKDVKVDFASGKYDNFNFKSIENAKNCIACFICNSVCPVMPIDKEFGGPFVFARAYGFLEDDRNQNKDYAKLMKGVLNHCTHCKNCNYACPLAVMPEVLIKKMEDKLISLGFLQAPQNDLFFGF